MSDFLQAYLHKIVSGRPARPCTPAWLSPRSGAIDFLGPKYGLPESLSGHQTWWLCGPRGYSGNCLIVLDDTQETLKTHFKHVEYVGRTPDNPYSLERELTVFICRGSKHGTLAEVRPHMKKWR